MLTREAPISRNWRCLARHWRWLADFVKRMDEIPFEVNLSGRERKSLERILGAEVEKVAQLLVRVKVKHEEKALEAESATPRRLAG